MPSTLCWVFVKFPMGVKFFFRPSIFDGAWNKFRFVLKCTIYFKFYIYYFSFAFMNQLTNIKYKLFLTCRLSTLCAGPPKAGVTRQNKKERTQIAAIWKIILNLKQIKKLSLFQKWWILKHKKLKIFNYLKSVK